MVDEKANRPIETYSHQSAMAQAPQPFILFGRLVHVKPLSERDCMELDNAVRFWYLQSHSLVQTNLSSEAAIRIANAVKAKAITLTYRHGEGHELLFASQLHYSTLIWHFLRRVTPALDIPAITSLCFKDETESVGHEHRKAYYDLSAGVFRAIPPPPPNAFRKKQNEKPTFLPTLEEEAVVRLYKALAERYHFTPDQIADLTHYQQYWLLFMLPEEAERLAQMEALAQRANASQHGGKIIPPPLPTPAGTVAMSPEEYETFMANRNNS